MHYQWLSDRLLVLFEEHYTSFRRRIRIAYKSDLKISVGLLQHHRGVFWNFRPCRWKSRFLYAWLHLFSSWEVYKWYQNIVYPHIFHSSFSLIKKLIEEWHFFHPKFFFWMSLFARLVCWAYDLHREISKKLYLLNI